MKISKRFNTILFKLSASYVAIIVISVLLTGVFASINFKNYSNSQIISTNEIILNDTCEFIDKDILTKADEVYLRLVLQSGENSVFSEMLNQGENYDYRLMNNMKQLLSEQQTHNSEWMSNMTVYFPKSDLFISSNGILYQRGESEQKRPVWVEEMIEGEKGFSYYPTTKYESGVYTGSERVCMLIRAYPMSAFKGQQEAYIIFGVRESAIAKILEKNIGKDHDNALLIVDEQGNVISGSGNIDKYSHMQSADYWEQLSERDEEEKEEIDKINVFTQKVDNVNYVLSYRNIDKYNWKIVSVVPEKVLFKGTRHILFVTILVCIAAMLLGFLISGFFTRRIYNPFKSILNSAMRTLDKQSGAESDEYGIINDAISRMENYNNTIEQNRNLIKYNFVNGVINNKFRDKDEVDSILKLCEKDFEGSVYTAILFTANKSLLDELTVENRRFIMFKLIEVIESLSDENVTYFAAEKDEYSVVAVSAYSFDEYDTVKNDAMHINDYMYTNCYIPFFAVVGEFTDDAIELKQSGKSINEAMEYRMFMAGKSVVRSEELLKREKSEAAISDEYFTTLKQALNDGDFETSKKTIEEIIREMIDGSYSAAHCNKKILEMGSVISGYLFEHNIHARDGEIRSFEKMFYAAEDIYEIRNWMIKVIEEAIGVMQIRKEEPSKCMVRTVREYIENNYKEELSLVSVAKKVHISSSYLSKIFKDETGVNFNNYVTKVRMDKASDLLLNSDMSIEEIAKEIGYNTDHYFIKKFRQIYGTTPKNYRMEHIK